jgi:preprotein translocase subunit SecG
MFFTSLFLILLVLVQRGRGGGLAGAFGGMGGQSAFGTKAGDLFTRLTMGAATFWIILCVLAIVVLNKEDSVFGEPSDGPSSAFEFETDPASTDGGSSVVPGGGLLSGSELDGGELPNLDSGDTTGASAGGLETPSDDAGSSDEAPPGAANNE